MKLHISRTLLSSSPGNLPDRQGFLYKKSFRTASYHQCWCELRGNILFCQERWGDRSSFRLIFLEGCIVELRESASEPHTFEISYPGDRLGIRAYKMAAENQETMEGWVRALSMAGSGYLRVLVTELEGQFHMLKSQQHPKFEEEVRHLSSDLRLSPSKLVGELASPSTDFAQLHQEFGEEIVKLRRKWQETQGKQRLEDERLVDLW